MKYFFIVFIFFAYTQNILAFSGDGDGLSAETAFIITTCAQLQEMNGELGAYYKLGNDIDCAETEGWNVNLDEWEEGDTDNPLIPDQYTGVVNNGYYGFEPIGWDSAANNSGTGFTGTLDGQSHTISNLWIFRKGNDFTGLIGYATNATIKNFTLNNPRVVGASSTGSFVGRGTNVILQNLENNAGMVRAYLEYYGGGIAGYLENSGTVTNLSVVGGTVHGSGNTIGGLVGLITNSSVSDSTSSADVDGGEYIGGAFGVIQNGSEVSDVDASGDVVSNDADDLYLTGFSKNGRYTGGFAGSIDDSIVQNSTASGIVTADQNYAGGFAGRITNSAAVSDSSATGIVSGDEYVGGFAGSIDNSTIIDAFSTGNVTSLGSYAGGFTGESLCGSSFLRASASGDVEAGNSYVGGFTGFDACEGPGSTFTQVAAHGDVVGNNVVGGFIGYGNVSTFTNVYSGGSVTANDQVGSFASDVTSSSLENVYARGLVTVTGGTFFGGFAKDATDTTITDSFWDSESIGQEDACQTGDCLGLNELTTVQAKTSTTYTGAGWDFEGIWEMNSDNDEYPHFFWESFGPMLGSGTEEDPYQVAQCFDATQSGYYQLQNNITNAFSDCITIEADDVFIDGDGHTIAGDSDEEGHGIFNEGYDSISISNITIESFDDGIRFNNSQGTSVITDVTVTDTFDDGMELRGVSGMTISDSTITNPDDQAITLRIFYNDLDQETYNSDITVQNVVVSDTGDYGMEFDYVTNLVVTENEISNTDDDGISMYIVENAELTNNTLDNIDSDGIYFEDSVNVLISENTINDVNDGDGIDLDYDSDGNTDVTVTDNVLTNIGDNGIEVLFANGAVITGNTINAYDRGFDVNESENIEFTGNTITPTISEFIEIPEIDADSLTLDILDADENQSIIYSSFTYTLPFTFNFQGRDITDIEVSSNGSIELLEDGESCQICGSSDSYKYYLVSDVLFASFDGLTTETREEDYVAVFSPDDEYVVVEWNGSTQYDYNSETYPVHFQVVLYPDGEVQWNFMEMNFQSYYYDMFTGAYDVETGDLYRAGLAINQPSSYRADFSGDTEYELIESFNPITGIDLYDVSESSFIGNDIQAEQWVSTEDIENVTFNDSDSGNTYRLLNGEGAWTMFSIVDTDGNGYADSGSDRPFSESILGATYWAGGGEDAYPATLTTVPVETPEVRKVTTSGSFIRSKRNTGDNKDRDGNGDEDRDGQKSASSSTNNAPVLTTRQLQRFLNTNGFPVALTGPGSLNNETDTFGELTKQALIKFQQANGITPALGIFGPITKAFINKNSSVTNTSSPATPQSSRDLELGMSGADVTKLQEFLIKSGHPISAGVTGYFGQQTKDALIEYQKANSILPASGYFGPKTRAQMKTVGLAL